MADSKSRGDRRAQQTAEIEASQVKLRVSIAETERLVGESDTMLQRHRGECDADEAAREASAARLSPPVPPSRP